ncbi:MAG TPA: translation initiation factor IF-3 [Candidatus Dormibacteraeota bacterium]|nr:translation initiation factor IF-3 [Candidatus Dormibacteraeota bacterium]
MQPFRKFQRNEPLHRRNGKIRAREVRVIDEDKQQLGVMTLDAALRLARDKQLDLVEIAAAATPPVCRIVNYGKFLYEESKTHKTNKPSGGRMKELQLSATIDPHDFQTKLNHAIEFLADDMKVRIKLRFKGRQKAHKEYGFEIVNRFVKEAAAHGKADSPPKMLGDRDLNVVISPLPRNQRGKVSKPADADAARGQSPAALPSAPGVPETSHVPNSQS